MPDQRERWGGRAAFLFAAIGSAVGLGNVWRFPYLAYQGGGGAFFLPYLLSVIFIGWPLLTLELALGQVFQTGDVNVFGKMNRRLRGIGVASIWTGFMIVCYYVVIIGYALIMMINVRREPWLGNEDGKGTLGEIGDNGFVKKCMLDEGQIIPDSDAALQYFLVEVVGLEFGRGLQCLVGSGTTYERQFSPNWGTHCAGEPRKRLADGSFVAEYGTWNTPCYKKDERDHAVCTTDAECEGLRTCQTPIPADFDMDKVPEDLRGNRRAGLCVGPARDGPDGTCNPCQKHKAEKDCWANKDTPGQDCYWIRDECRTGTFREVAPFKNGGYHNCLDDGYVPEWGGSYSCAAVEALGLCGHELAKQRCAVTCDACIHVKYEQACDNGAWGFVGPLYGAVVVTWVLVALCLIFGIRITGFITYFTMTVPFILIVVLFFAGVTLDGAGEGARQYIGRWDFSDLTTNPRLWSDAAGQTFFTLSIGFGIMTAYSSYNRRDQNTVIDAIIIVFADTLTAFIAGFTVFCIVGNFAYKKGVPFEEVGSLSGLFLAFVTYPVALSKLSGGAAWCGVFFFTLVMLGIDSAFSIAEAVVTALHDARRFQRVPRMIIVIGVALVALVFGVFYCLDNGLYIFDTVDWYLSNVSLVFIGLMQCIAVGWVYGYKEQSAKVGGAAVGIHNITWFVAVFCGALSAFWIGGKDGCVMGLTLAIITILVGSCLSFYWIDRCLAPHMTEHDRAFELWMGNIEDLRADMNQVIVPPGSKNTRIPLFWSVVIKYIIPPALTCIFCITFESKFGYYENYSSRYQAAGIVISFMTVILTALGVIFPSFYNWLAPSDGHLAETEDDLLARLGSLPAPKNPDADHLPTPTQSPTSQARNVAVVQEPQPMPAPAYPTLQYGSPPEGSYYSSGGYGPYNTAVPPGGMAVPPPPGMMPMQTYTTGQPEAFGAGAMA